MSIPGPTKSTSTILLVDDHLLLREAIGGALAEAGYSIVQRSDSESAIQAALELGSAIDLMITDIDLDGESGWRLADTLSARVPKILFISAQADWSASERGPRWRDAPLLIKPFGIPTLLERVRQSLHAGGPKCEPPSRSEPQDPHPPENSPRPAAPRNEADGYDEAFHGLGGASPDPLPEGVTNDENSAPDRHLSAGPSSRAPVYDRCSPS